MLINDTVCTMVLTAPKMTSFHHFQDFLTTAFISPWHQLVQLHHKANSGIERWYALKPEWICT